MSNSFLMRPRKRGAIRIERHYYSKSQATLLTLPHKWVNCSPEAPPLHTGG